MPPKADTSAPTDILIDVLIHITPITFPGIEPGGDKPRHYISW